MIYLATFGLIFLDFVLADINDHELNFVAKNDLSPIQFFLYKERSFQRYEEAIN